MGVLDQIGRSIAKGGQSALNKTKDIAEIVKLSSNTADLEHQIEALYTELGQQYYGLHQQVGCEALADTVEEITAKQAELARLRENVEQLKGSTKCPHCGATVAANLQFCGNCGKPVVAPTPGKHCTACGAVIPPDAAFCTSCGTPVAKG